MNNGGFLYRAYYIIMLFSRRFLHYYPCNQATLNKKIIPGSFSTSWKVYSTGSLLGDHQFIKHSYHLYHSLVPIYTPG